MPLLAQLTRLLRNARRRRAFEKAYRAESGTARPGRHQAVFVLDHLVPARNAAIILRTADAFGVRAAYLVGTDHFEPVLARGALRSVPLRFFGTFAEAHRELAGEGYALFALEPERDFAAPALLHRTAFPEKTAFVVGNESRGLSFSPEEFPGVVPLSIPQYGVVVGSLNVSVAASVAMYEYVRQHAKP